MEVQRLIGLINAFTGTPPLSTYMGQTTQSEGEQKLPVESQQDSSNTELSTIEIRLWNIISPEALAILTSLFAAVMFLNFLLVTQVGALPPHVILADAKNILLNSVPMIFGSLVLAKLTSQQ